MWESWFELPGQKEGKKEINGEQSVRQFNAPPRRNGATAHLLSPRIPGLPPNLQERRRLPSRPYVEPPLSGGFISRIPAPPPGLRCLLVSLLQRRRSQPAFPTAVSSSPVVSGRRSPVVASSRSRSELEKEQLPVFVRRRKTSNSARNLVKEEGQIIVIQKEKEFARSSSIW
ncbi:hypothetical protein Droror1_Dr00005539 [Drosera rotundifolia]